MMRSIIYVSMRLSIVGLCMVRLSIVHLLHGLCVCLSCISCMVYTSIYLMHLMHLMHLLHGLSFLHVAMEQATYLPTLPVDM